MDYWHNVMCMFFAQGVMCFCFLAARKGGSIKPSFPNLSPIMEVGQNISTYPKSKKHTYYFVPINMAQCNNYVFGS